MKATRHSCTVYDCDEYMVEDPQGWWIPYNEYRDLERVYQEQSAYTRRLENMLITAGYDLCKRAELGGGQ